MKDLNELHLKLNATGDRSLQKNIFFPHEIKIRSRSKRVKTDHAIMTREDFENQFNVR